MKQKKSQKRRQVKSLIFPATEALVQYLFFSRRRSVSVDRFKTPSCSSKLAVIVFFPGVTPL